MPTKRGRTAVYLEEGSKRVFACAFDWPGWCRSGRDERRALAALAGAAPRFAVVAAEAGIPFPDAGDLDLEVVERVPGSATTEFGAPGAIPVRDAEPLGREEAERLAALVSASWTVLDRVVASAPAELRKGPRGGGRDRDAIVEHVAGAEVMYARKMGVGRPGAAGSVAALREAVAAALRDAAGRPVPDRGWPARYAARRIAWHALDHAWEIEDRTEPAA